MLLLLLLSFEKEERSSLSFGKKKPTLKEILKTTSTSNF
jgi:hypothetical protein